MVNDDNVAKAVKTIFDSAAIMGDFKAMQNWYMATSLKLLGHEEARRY